MFLPSSSRCRARWRRRSARRPGRCGDEPPQQLDRHEDVRIHDDRAFEQHLARERKRVRAVGLAMARVVDEADAIAEVIAEPLLLIAGDDGSAARRYMASGFQNEASSSRNSWTSNHQRGW